MTKVFKSIVYGLLSIVLCFSSSYAAQAKSTVPSPQIDEITAKAEAIDSYTADIQITMLKEPEKVAGGMAIGVAIGLTPTIPLHLVLGVFIAFLLGKSKLAAALGSQVANPFFFPFIYILDYRLGQ